MNLVSMVQEVSFHKGTILTALYANRLDALRVAGKSICSHMESIGMHHNLNKNYSTYVAIKQLVQIDSQRSLLAALDEYDMFVTYLPVEERTFITVSTKGIIDSVVFNNTSVSTTTTVNPPVQKKVDKPCKQCSRNVSEDEDSCWYCGVKNPGK